MIHFDCHAHVYERVSAVPGARYTPTAPAPLAKWLNHQESHGLKGGVIVQVSFLGTDNSELCTALSGLDQRRFAGVGAVALTVDDAELDRLVAAGVRGIRWNLVGGVPVPDLASAVVQTFLGKLRTRGLHLEIHLEGPRLAGYLPFLADQGLNVVIDHFGLPTEPNPSADPMLNAVRETACRTNLFFKFSGHYRTAFDLAPHADVLLGLLTTKHVVWGSDWPHTQHESSVGYCDTFDAVSAAKTVADLDVANVLYGISASSEAV